MSGLCLNQVTLAAKNMAASVEFYQNLGLILIIDSAPRYVRFECPPNETFPNPITLSLHHVADDWEPPQDWPLIYFEVDNLKDFITRKSLSPITSPTLKPYLWEEADILDPSGNKIRLYHAGDNRRFPPWRISSS